MKKKLVVLLVAIALFGTGKISFAEQKAAPAKAEKSAPVKAAPAKQPKVVETRLSESEVDKIVSSVNRAVQGAIVSKQGPSGWEYMAKRMKPPKNDKWKEEWNDLGKEGWEAIDHFENIYIFKRPAGIAAATPKVDKKAAKQADKKAKEDEKKQKAEKEKADKEAKKAEQAKAKEAKKAAKEAGKAKKTK